jgi:glycosyltransferase involved in cell wall biosynthesis
MAATSVILCTRDRPAGCAAAVESILGGARAADELVVVDQSRGDDTRRALSAHIVAGRLCHLRSAQTGLSRGRNAGLRHATGDVLLFTDDDCIVPPEWVERMDYHVRRRPAIGAVLGPVVAPATPADAGYTPVFEPPEAMFVARPDRMPLAGPMGANMGFRRAALDAIGGFDELLGPGAALWSADDIDAVYRVLRAGFAVAIETEPAVHHLGFRSRRADDDLRHRRAAYRAIGAYYAKHIRCLDVAAARNLARQLFATSAQAPGNVRANPGRRRTYGLPMMLLGALASVRYPVDRHARKYRAVRRSAP